MRDPMTHHPRRAAARRPLSALTMLLAVALACTSLQAIAPETVEAQRTGMDISRPFEGQRPFQLDVHAGFTWWGLGFASGVRFGIPILNNGFIDSINNAVYINFGFDFYWVRWRRGGPGANWEYHAALGLPVTLHWEFYFNDSWSAFAEIGFQIFFHPALFRNNDFFIDAGQWFVFAIGGTWHITENVGLTVRVGNPYVSGGVTFEF